MSIQRQEISKGAPLKAGARVRIAKLLSPPCPGTLGVGREGIVRGFVNAEFRGREELCAHVEFDWCGYPYRLAYLPEELAVLS